MRRNKLDPMYECRHPPSSRVCVFHLFNAISLAGHHSLQLNCPLRTIKAIQSSLTQPDPIWCCGMDYLHKHCSSPHCSSVTSDLSLLWDLLQLIITPQCSDIFTAAPGFAEDKLTFSGLNDTNTHRTFNRLLLLSLQLPLLTAAALVQVWRVL